jgi:dihydrofolate reductase
MRKLVLKMSITADGFVGGPEGEIDWLFRSMDEEVAAWIVETLWSAGTHIMGSRTFQDMAAHWPSSTEPFAAPMNEIPKVIFSRKGAALIPDAKQTTAALKDARRKHPSDMKCDNDALVRAESWAHPLVASGDLADEIAVLKQQSGKDILAHGGAGFARSLARLRLIDEYRLIVHPVAIGRGLPLFSDLSAPIHLALVSTVAFRTGAVAHVYRPKKG